MSAIAATGCNRRARKASKRSGSRCGTVPPRTRGCSAPLKQLAAEAGKNPLLPKSLWLLLRQIDAELTGLDGAGLLRQVDGTTPTTDPTDVSYRYPFRDANGLDVAPRDWTTADWDAYQGNAAGVAAAIDRFLRAVDNWRQRTRAAT